MAYKDGFVIEYVDRGDKISCYKCFFFDKEDRSCSKTGIYVPDVGYGQWKTCPHFELSSDYDNKRMREEANRIRAGAHKKNSKEQQSKKTAGKKYEKTPTNQRAERANSKSTAKTQPKKEASKFDSRMYGSKVQQLYPFKKRVDVSAYSPQYGHGRAVKVEGRYVTVQFVQGSKRICYDALQSIGRGKLVLSKQLIAALRGTQPAPNTSAKSQVVKRSANNSKPQRGNQDLRRTAEEKVPAKQARSGSNKPASLHKLSSKAHVSDVIDDETLIKLEALKRNL